MQVQFRGSGYPDDLKEKFIIQEDAARRYVPAEPKTLVINFREHWNMSVERKGSKRFSPFKNSLSEQFSLMSYDTVRSRELIGFIWSALYSSTKTKVSRSVFFSHPSFYKVDCTDPDSPLMRSLQNVALRIPLKGRDLVLMGDVIDYHDNKTRSDRREYVVKGFSLMSPSSHYGEVKVEAALIARVMNSSMQGFYTPKGELAEGAPMDVYRNTVLTPSLIGELNETYVVKDPGAVISQLKGWSDLLTTERIEADENEIKGYTVERPEFMVAYPVAKGTSVVPERVLLETEDSVWTTDILPNSTSARMVVRIRHPVNRKLFESNDRYIDDFNTLTTLGVKIVDPLAAMSERTEHLSRKEKDRVNRMTRIGEERLAPASLNGSVPFTMSEETRAERDREIEAVRNRYKQAVGNKAMAMVREYIATDEVRQAVDAYLAECGEQIRSDAENERRLKADSICLAAIQSGNPVKYSDALASVSDDECIAAATDRLRKQKERELSDLRKEEFREEADRSVDEQRGEEISAIYRKYGGSGTVLSDDGPNELMVYYEVYPAKGESVREAVESRNRYFAGVSQCKMVCDQTGTQRNNRRQRDALESFMSGEVANPYLASYLFSTENTKVGITPHIAHFFGTRFNDLQKKAVEEALDMDGVYLIQGPPGTGKTQVISEITSQEVLRGRRVLITSQNNKAIDNAFERLYSNPLVRPVRLMSEEKTSDYELQRIVANFYRNVSKSLGDQLERFGSIDVKRDILGRFENVRELYEAYSDAKEDAEDVLLDIEDDEIDILSMSQKINDARMHNEEKATKGKLVESLEKGLDIFELTTYSEYSREIKDMFRPFVTMPARVSDKESESDLEGRLFGQFGYCAGLMSVTDEQFDEEMDLHRKHAEYVNLYRRLCRAEDDAARSDLSDSIDRYVEAHGLHVDAFRLLRMFGPDLPDALPEKRDRLGRIRQLVSHRLEERRAAIECSEEEDIDITAYERKVEDFREELEELKEDKAYLAYLEAENALRGPVQDMFAFLGINDRFSDLGSAYDLLRRRVLLVTSLSDKDSDLSEETCQDIIGYLGAEGVDEVDHDRLMKELRDYVNVVGITCTAEGSAREEIEGEDDPLYLDVTTMGIDVVIIDEISKVPFPELLRPILSGKTVIMVGDHKQLPPIYNVKYDRLTASPDDPVVQREEAFKKLYTTSLFEMLFERAPEQRKIMLKKQYRMSSQIMAAINRFYGGELEMGCDDKDKMHHITIQGRNRALLDDSRSILFVNCKGTGIRQSGSMSFENALEAKVVAKLADLLERNCHSDRDGNPLDDDGKRMSLGVISPYAAQTRLIKKLTDRMYEQLARSGRASAFQTEGEERFMVKSVDDFQGDERDIIILSLVRTSRSQFISDFRRINVAMSRARRLLVLVGNAETLEAEGVRLSADGEERLVYKEIIDDIRANGGYLEAKDILEAN